MKLTERHIRSIVKEEIKSIMVEGLFDIFRSKPKEEGALQKASTALGDTNPKTPLIQVLYKLMDRASTISHKGGMVRFTDPRAYEESMRKTEILVNHFEDVLKGLNEKEFAKVYNEADKLGNFQDATFLRHNMNSFYSGDPYIDSRSSYHQIWDKKLELIKV
jgi:hypothetical protein